VYAKTHFLGLCPGKDFFPEFKTRLCPIFRRVSLKGFRLSWWFLVNLRSSFPVEGGGSLGKNLFLAFPRGPFVGVAQPFDWKIFTILVPNLCWGGKCQGVSSGKGLFPRGENFPVSLVQCGGSFWTDPNFFERASGRRLFPGQNSF